MTKDEALNLCLRVLRPISEDRVYETRWLGDAIEAAVKALEQPACKHGVDDGCCKECYTEQTQPAQEPVEVIASGTSTWGNVKPSWQGLSDDEIGMYWDRVIADDEDSSEFTQIRFARAIEQALKEKNHEQTN